MIALSKYQTDRLEELFFELLKKTNNESPIDRQKQDDLIDYLQWIRQEEYTPYMRDLYRTYGLELSDRRTSDEND